MNIQEIKLKYNDIFKILTNGNDNYIFGYGWMGKHFEATISPLGINFKGFVVSQKKQDKIDNFPIYDISEMKTIIGKKNIFVALRDQDESLNQHLEKIFDVVYPITFPVDIAIMEAQYYLNLLTSAGIDIEKKYINIKDFYFINPFMQSYDYLLSWVYEAGDLLLPGLLNNYTRIDEGAYENGEVNLQKNDIVFDCGANIGLFSTIAQQKGCIVYAFEPMPTAIGFLQELHTFLHDNFHIVPYALSDTSGTATFHAQSFDLLGASLLEKSTSTDQNYIVNVTTLDEFVKSNHIEKVDFIKADIEGAERDMIWGAKETIQKYTPKLSICTYHLEDDKQVLEKRIKEINPNYIVEHKWKKLYAYIPKK